MYPWNGGRGPTRSTWTWSDRCWGDGEFRGAMTWPCTLAHWQSRQVLAQVLTCLDRRCQTNLEISFTVVLAPGLERQWTVSNTLRRREAWTGPPVVLAPCAAVRPRGCWTGGRCQGQASFGSGTSPRSACRDASCVPWSGLGHR